MNPDRATEVPADVLLTAEQIQSRVRELGAAVSRDYAGSDLILLCILRGGVVFLADLMRAITIPHAIDFMALASYGAGARQSAGEVRITLDLNGAIAGRDVLLVEDIIDSGRTLALVLDLLRARKPRSLEICVLLDKPDRREVKVPVRYRGFAIPDRYVFGYGLDLDERYRNLPHLAALPGEPPAPAGASRRRTLP